MISDAAIERRLRKLPETHPAVVYYQTILHATSECRGKELGIDGPAINQRWLIQSGPWEGKMHSFGNLMYQYMCRLWGPLRAWADAEYRNETNEIEIETPDFRARLDECRHAAVADKNSIILEKIQIVEKAWSDGLAFLEFCRRE